jgi:hypothetical protein
MLILLHFRAFWVIKGRIVGRIFDRFVCLLCYQHVNSKNKSICSTEIKFNHGSTSDCQGIDILRLRTCQCGNNVQILLDIRSLAMS